MAAKCGRLEAQYTLTTAWEFSATDSGGGPTTGTIIAGDYFASQLVDEFRSELEVIGSGDWTVTLSAGESGTGRVTIANPSGPWSITWTTTTLRDALGFTADISGVSSNQTGAGHVRGLWLPGAIKFTPHGDGNDSSTYVSTHRQTVNNRGDVRTIAGGGRFLHSSIRWEGVSGPRSKRVQETITYESFESWWLDTQVAANGTSMFQPGAAVRLYWDADDSNYAEGRLVVPRTFDPAPMVNAWTGRYTIQLGRLEVGA